MANLPHGGMMPLAHHAGDQGKAADWIKTAWDAVMDTKLKDVAKNAPRYIPAVAPRDKDAPGFGDLNLKPLQQTKVTHLIDFVPDWDGPIDCDEVMRLARASDYSAMPEPLRPKDPAGFRVAYEMSIVVDKKPNGKTDVLKWIEFTNPQFAYKIKDQLIYGEALQPDWAGKDVYRTKRVLLYLLERVNGHRLFYKELDDGKPKNKKARKNVDIAAKYDYLRAKAHKFFGL